MGRIPVADTAYLKRRRGKGRTGSRWYVRVPVPVDLQPVFRKATIERALHTEDRKEAQKKKHSVLTEIFATFDRARLHKITSEDIEVEARRYLTERIAELRAHPGDAFAHSVDDNDCDYGPGALPYLDELAEGLTDGEWEPRITREAERIARSYGVTLSNEQSKELCRALQLAEVEAVQRVLSIEEGVAPEPLGIINAKAAHPITGAVQPPTQPTPKQASGSGIHVHDAGEAYIGEKSRRKRRPWTAQTVAQAKATFRLFEEHTRNAPLQFISRADVTSFLSAIEKLDPNYGRRSGGRKKKGQSNDEQTLSLAKLIKKRGAPDGVGLSVRTLNRHAAMLAGMFDWAIRKEKFKGTNPAKGHHQPHGGHDNQEPVRRHFELDELKRLFGGSLFQAPAIERVCPPKHSANTALAWLIPIALFSGMRLDEICGLRLADVKDAEGVLYFDVTSHEGRRLKTEAARRLVPVHSELLRIGFGQYVEHVRKQGHDYLFPGLKPGGPDGKRSWYVGKRFTDYRRSVTVSAKETTFHCFRKNAATALERARIPEIEAVRVIGHRLETMTYGLYSGGLDLPGLKRVVEAIQYPGLDLSPLHYPATARKSRAAKRGEGRKNSPGIATEAR